MPIIAKQKTVDQPLYSENYELFQPVTMTDVDGNEVQVLQSIGVYFLDSLIYQKQQLELQISDLNTKIEAIHTIQNV